MVASTAFDWAAKKVALMVDLLVVSRVDKLAELKVVSTVDL